MSFLDVKRLREIAEVKFADLVIATAIPDTSEVPEEAWRAFLTFVRNKIKSLSS